MNIANYNLAAIRAGQAGDLRALVSLAGMVARLARAGGAVPPDVKWLWDPEPILEWEGGREACAPLSLGGPVLLDLWTDEGQRPQVSAWLGRALGRMYAGDWGALGREDREANERSLTDGSRLMAVYPWFGKTDGKDLWIFVEAAHGEDVRYRRVSALHRNDY